MHRHYRHQHGGSGAASPPASAFHFPGSRGRNPNGLPSAAAPGRAGLEGVRERDPQALEAFFEAHFDRIYSLAFRLLSNVDSAEDVTQEVFFKVHRAAHQLDPDRDPRPWLNAITYNTCREFWRSGAHKMTRRTVSLQDKPEMGSRIPAGGASPESDLLASERERQVQQAVMKLPEALRAAVLLHDYEGLGHEEIASMTGVSHAAARKRYSRALTELAKHLKDLGS